MEKKPVYLLMVTTENNNKFYNLTPISDTEFKAEWGRVGGSASSKVYPMSKWSSTISSKIKKGYKERTDLMADIIEDAKIESTPSGKDKFSIIGNVSVRDIIKRLFDFANKTIQSSYKVSSSQVTQAMVDAAQKELDFIGNNYKNLTLAEFNEHLLTLFTIIPRKMKNVKDYLASSPADIEKILVREQDTLDTMAGQVYKPKKATIPETTKGNTDLPIEKSILDEMGISMEDVTEEDVVRIKKAMGDVADKYYKAWRVTNFETEETFKKFTSENKIGNVRLLCHGSRNQNWFNILKIGLKFRPAGAITTGLMWGAGIYWSNPDKYHGGVRKSIGYTSLGGYWTHDYQNCGFIAFFDVACGKMEEAWDHSSKYYSYDLATIQKKDKNVWSLWAHGGTNSLRNDEIIVYTDKQMTIRYLVEIRN